MNRIITAAFLVAVLGAAISYAGTPPQPESQPEPQIRPAPEVFIYSSPGRSYLGVDIQDVTKERMSALKLKEERGVEITMVDQDAPAGKAGLKEHDVILDFNGTAIESEEQLRRLIRETPPGRTVNLGISRDGNPIKVSVQLGDRGQVESSAHTKVVPPMPAVKIPRVEIPQIEISPSYSFQIQTYSYLLGVQTESLSRQLGEFFGVKDGEGILVRSVEKGSAAEKAGLKAGDVIIRADNEKVSDRSDLSHILRRHREGGKLSLVVVREKREQTLVVDLPARNSGSSWRLIDSDDLQSIWEEVEGAIESIEPEVEHTREMATLRMQEEVANARQKVREMQPQIDKAMRDAQQEVRKARKLLEKQKLEFKKQLDTWI
jgi:serine protease Do